MGPTELKQGVSGGAGSFWRLREPPCPTFLSVWKQPLLHPQSQGTASPWPFFHIFCVFLTFLLTLLSLVRTSDCSGLHGESWVSFPSADCKLTPLCLRHLLGCCCLGGGGVGVAPIHTDEASGLVLRGTAPGAGAPQPLLSLMVTPADLRHRHGPAQRWVQTTPDVPGADRMLMGPVMACFIRNALFSIQRGLHGDAQQSAPWTLPSREVGTCRVRSGEPWLPGLMCLLHVWPSSWLCSCPGATITENQSPQSPSHSGSNTEAPPEKVCCLDRNWVPPPEELVAHGPEKTQISQDSVCL